MQEQELSKQLDSWGEHGLGAMLQAQELEAFDAVLPGLFGYYLLQIGGWSQRLVASASPIRHQCRISLEPSQRPLLSPIYSKWEQLPLKTDSVDVILLPHTLEMSQYPHEVLREVERILLPEGHVVISGFNPISFWGLVRCIPRLKRSMPWNANTIRLGRLEDWLRLLGMEIVQQRVFFYRPPLNHPRIMALLRFVESVGRIFWPWFGGMYLIVARKRVSTVTPQPLRWRLRRQILQAGVVENMENKVD